MQSLRYNSFDYQKHIGSVIEFYDKFSKISNDDCDGGSNNIFILGTPRSGTTLIESISSNNEVEAQESLRVHSN